MAFIRSKIKNGNKYFYIVESKRIDGKVRQSILEYLGPADKLADLALKGWMAENHPEQSDTSDISFRSYLHGSCMAMYYMAQKIGVEQIMDKHFPAKTVKGMTRSRVLLLAMIHRAIDPGSKRSFTEWAKETSLPYYLKFDADDLDSQAFWEAMDDISKEQIEAAQRDIVEKAIALTGIDLKTFHLDYTNYFTFIDSRNGRCVIAQRGHNKQKRDDLRQYSLAMLTSYGLQIPIIWELYEGNKNDKSEFSDFTDLIEKELKAHNIELEEVTITFDGGSNSEENFKDLKFHFICAHSMTGMKELYEIDLNEYKKVKTAANHERLAYRLDHLTFSGINGTGILTYSSELEDGQKSQLKKDLASIEELCTDINEKLKNAGCRIYSDLRKKKELMDTAIQKAEAYNVEIKKHNAEKKKGKPKKEKEIPVWDEEAALKKLLEDKVYQGNKYIREFSSVSVYKNQEGIWQMAFNINEESQTAYCRKYFGKKLICTDHKDWSTEQILIQYGEQECIETNIFKVSKDTDHFSVRPQHHWTDQKIMVHTFICLWSMIIAEMLRIDMEAEGIKLTKAALLDKLSTIRDGWIFSNEKKVKRTMEKMDDEQKKLWSAVEKIREGLPTIKKTRKARAKSKRKTGTRKSSKKKN